MTKQYIFIASGDSCAVCEGMNGQLFSEPPGEPHDGCQCQVEAVDDEDCPTYSVGEISSTYEADSSHFSMGAELIVTCCDGSEIAQSVDFDMGTIESYSGADIFDVVDEHIDEAATELADECPEEEESLCC